MKFLQPFAQEAEKVLPPRLVVFKGHPEALHRPRLLNLFITKQWLVVHVSS